MVDGSIRQKCLSIFLSSAIVAAATALPAFSQSQISYPRNKPFGSAPTSIVPTSAQMHDALVLRGFEHVKKREYKDAISVFSDAIKLSPKNSHDFYFRGRVHGLMNNSTAAIADYTESIKLHADNPYSFLERGKTYYLRGNYKSALDDLTQTVKLIPNDPSAHEYRGLALSALYKHDDAINEITTALALVQVSPPQSREAQLKKHFGEVNVVLAEKEKARLTLLRGIARNKKTDYPAALVDLNYALKLDPSLLKGYLERARAQFKSDNREQALADLDRYMKMGRSPEVYNNAADLYTEMHEDELAKNALTLASGKQPPKPDQAPGADAKSGSDTDAKPSSGVDAKPPSGVEEKSQSGADTKPPTEIDGKSD